MHLNNIPKNLDSSLWKIKNFRMISNLLRMFWVLSWSSTGVCNKHSIVFPTGSLENFIIVLHADAFSWNIYNNLKSVDLKMNNLVTSSNFFSIVGSTSHLQENLFFILFLFSVLLCSNYCDFDNNANLVRRCWKVLLDFKKLVFSRLLTWNSLPSTILRY